MSQDQEQSIKGDQLNLPARTAEIQRKTRETDIKISLNLDGHGLYEIDSGIGFLDHMLSHLAVHGLFDLTVQATGDLHIDPHHTMEDIAIVLGQAFDRALGDRSGIMRMASSYAPMDETLAFVAVDFSGRPFAVIKVEWSQLPIGGLPPSLFEHFLESLAFAARANLHAQVLYGRDDHHKAEALFKAMARAFDAATQLDSRRSGSVPSTKGMLAA